MMRRILVDHSRRHDADKRGGGAVRAPLEEALTVPMQERFDMVALDSALDQLAAFDARKSRIADGQVDELTQPVGKNLHANCSRQRTSPWNTI